MSDDRDIRISIRVTREESELIKKDAKEAGKTLSTHGRDCLLKAPETAPTYIRTETRDLMKYLIGQIGRVGNNMNQIAYKLNSNMMMVSVDRAQLEEGVRTLKDMRSLLTTHLINRGPC